MTISWIMEDVPVVSVELLGQAMKILIDNGRGLALLNGLSDYDRNRLAGEFLAACESSEEEVYAALVRLDELIHVFSSQRLKDLLLENGYGLLWHAVRVAAGQRLNARWGFKSEQVFLGAAS